MSGLGLYVPGRSFLHRVPAAAKLATLLLAGAGSVLLDEPSKVGAALLLVVVGFAASGLGWRRLARQVRPVLVVLLVLTGLQAVVAGWERAVVVGGVVLTLVLLAALVTLTTQTSDLVDVVVGVLRPLRRLGVDPERVGLLVALSIRSVPVVVGLAHEVRDAQRARGLTGSPRAYAVPLVIRSLRHADELAEALVARGVDD